MPEAFSTVDDLFEFLTSCPTPYHATNETIRRLVRSGYHEHRRVDGIHSPSFQKQVVRYGDGALVAVDTRGARISDGVIALAAHTDSPALRVKERGAWWRGGYFVIPTELYGSPILSTWTDVDLEIAGRAVTNDGRVATFRLPERVIIPNLAIHLNRTVNEGFAYNPHDHLRAVVAVEPGRSDGRAEDELRARIASVLDTTTSAVIEYEALLCAATPPSYIGADRSLFSAHRIDNLAGCYANMQALLSPGEMPVLLVLYNHEEVGSASGEGAQSRIVVETVRRYVTAEGGTEADVDRALARSLVISNDAAHAVHPLYTDKSDADYGPVLGGGPVLKLNGSYRYATTARSAAVFAAACDRAGIPLQRMTNRSDMRAGSTVGPVTWAQTGASTVDVGMPILAMHSARETAGTSDVHAMIGALQALLAHPDLSHGVT